MSRDDQYDLRNHVTAEEKAKLDNRVGDITVAQANYGIELENLREHVPAEKMVAFEKASLAAFTEINDQVVNLANALKDATQYVKQVQSVNTRLTKAAAGKAR